MSIRRGFTLALLVLIAPAARPATVGEVSFPNSGAAEAQGPFLRGVALLHNFEYRDAADAFREAREIDPDFALAYWGEAMTHHHPIWMEHDREAAREVLARLGATPEERRAKAPTAREQAWLETAEILYGEGERREREVAWSKALGRMHRSDPDDPEAAALYAVSILGTAHEGRDFATYMRAAAVAEEAYIDHPRHPGVLHYLIHSYDDPVHAPLGLRAARTYAEVAPDAAHAQHMTSHIFVALGMWDDVVLANENAAAVRNRARKRRGRLPSHCGHYNFWLLYGYTQQGRHGKARELLAACRDDALDAMGGASPALDPDNSTPASFVQMRTRYLIDTGEWNGEAAGWELELSEEHAPERVNQAYTAGLVAAGLGDAAGLDAALGRLRETCRALDAFVVEEPLAYSPAFVARAAILEGQLEAMLHHARGETGAALARLAQAAGDEAALPLTFGPPFIDKPGHELLGEWHLALGHHDEAMAAFQAALSRAPGRNDSLRGLAEAARKADDATTAADARRRLQSNLTRAAG